MQYSHEIDNAGLSGNAGLKPQPTQSKPIVYIDEEGFLPVQYGQVQPKGKHWWESKTIWFNLIIVAVGLATSATPALEQYMSAEMYGVIASFVAFINAVLRVATGQPIKTPSNMGGGRE